MMNSYVSCYQFYDIKGRRLSAFCRWIDGKAEVVTFACSKSDQFSRKYARTQYEAYCNGDLNILQIKPNMILLKCVDENHTLTTLLDYLKENYFILIDVEVPQLFTYIVPANATIIKVLNNAKNIPDIDVTNN